jgi:hypothetical protein
MVLLLVTIEAEVGQDEALRKTMEELAPIYARHQTAVRVFEPRSGSMTRYLALFEFSSMSDWGQWGARLQEDAQWRETMAKLRSLVRHWDNNVYVSVSAP